MNQFVIPLLLALAVFIAPRTAFAQNFPANGEISEELAIGGPSIDYLTLEFPRAGVAQCAPFTGQTRSVRGDLTRYGKALLVVIFPQDCPYCIAAADAAEPIIAKYRSQLTVWYANQRLNGNGSCADITAMVNKYEFVRNADFRFIDIYMWNNVWNSPWHYGSQDSYWSRKESPSVYRIFNPRTRKVTGINYYVGPIESQIEAAIADNQTPTTVLDIDLADRSHRTLSLSYNRTSAILTLCAVEQGPFLVEILDARGRTVVRAEHEGAGREARVSLGQLPEGVYMARYQAVGMTVGAMRFIKH